MPLAVVGSASESHNPFCKSKYHPRHEARKNDLPLLQERGIDRMCCAIAGGKICVIRGSFHCRLSCTNKSLTSSRS